MSLSAQVFKNKHKGRIAIIAGTGPSLLDYGHKDVDDHILICINNSLIHFTYCDYFFAVDNTVMQEECWDQVKQGKAPHVILTEEFKRFQNKYDLNVTRLHRNNESRVMAPGASRLIMGKDAVHSACHLALIMGCIAIALIGVDLKFQGPRKYAYDNPIGEQGPEPLELSRKEWKLITLENDYKLPIYNCCANSSEVGLLKASLKEVISLHSNQLNHI